MQNLIQEFRLIDSSSGEVVVSHSSTKISKLKKGWFAMYKLPIQKLITEVPNFATLKVFLLLSSVQDYETVTIISNNEIARLTQLSYPSVWKSINWLLEHEYIKKASVNGVKGYILNPSVSTCGTDKIPDRLEYFAEPDNLDFDITGDKKSSPFEKSPLPKGLFSSDDDDSTVVVRRKK